MGAPLLAVLREVGIFDSAESKGLAVVATWISRQSVPAVVPTARNPTSYSESLHAVKEIASSRSRRPTSNQADSSPNKEEAAIGPPEWSNSGCHPPTIASAFHQAEKWASDDSALRGSHPVW